MQKIKLSQLVDKIPDEEGFVVEGKLDGVTLSGFSFDSRTVQSNELFGVFEPDLDRAMFYIEQAIELGVVAFVVSKELFSRIRETAKYSSYVWLVHRYHRRFFAKLVGAHYSSQPKNCVAVTGTSGKTSVADLVRQIWVGCGLKAASIGTLGVVSNVTIREVLPEQLTSPDPVSLLKLLSLLKQQGVEHVVLEASSHGIDQGRSEGVKFSGAAFTNLSQDHLDYHLTMESYFHAKMRLFSEVIPSGAWAMLNGDIEEYKSLYKACIDRGVVATSFGKSGDFVQLVGVVHDEGFQRVEFKIGAEQYSVDYYLLGMAQVYNLLCAVGIVLRSGVDVQSVLAVIPELVPIPGRLEKVAEVNGAKIYVDYAHKPGALESVLKDVREYTKGMVHVVFGCGGDRDSDKRPKMGSVANQLADAVIVTDDNPRTEDAATIRKNVLSKCAKGIEVAGRKEAIAYAISQLSLGDSLVVAGKGHESYQIVGLEKQPFDDAEVIRELVKSSKV